VSDGKFISIILMLMACQMRLAVIAGYLRRIIKLIEKREADK
jgi:hypothetical protein